MADAKLTALSAETEAVASDLAYLVDDVAGTPTSKKITVENLLSFRSIFAKAEISITGATTATIGRMHVCSGTSADYTLTLPAVSGNTGKLLGVRMAAIAALSKRVTIDGNASETIDGSLTRVMWANESAILMCDGSNWFKIAGKSIPMIAQMHLGTTQTGVAPSTVTKINVDTSDIDNTAAMVDTTNKQINILRASLYGAVGTIRVIAMPVGGGVSSPGVAKGGTSFSQIALITLAAAEQSAISVLGTVSAAAADAITLSWYQSGGANAEAYGDVLANGPCVLGITEIPQW